MTPKEKAQELYRTYIDYTYGDFNCKQCALIAVDETLWVLNELDHDLPDDDAILFYSEVKQEIEKL
jgi:hypothetical protein